MGKTNNMMMKPMMSQKSMPMSKGSQCVDGLKRTNSMKAPKSKKK